ncbi:uncharacterized protein NECHADRAFT_87268 [Fusarium vanettenii 77-13-4]|uniref:NB-ARC domain-containing protein n=1 Tax=Fusarium vanettenii (strain ATCC MYA-4622 / CBS 123669 / FGSC 9596 / NRRL 45880 / 77-13-4) TaxID=660122 RepID=C7ZIU6_FUSV7|nr:uncharacterized protein NECHADRAFT_87268 [Fusarium vanettenii 77-13-4]EEU36089.1 hypothetical protein NECHADRAFT_87268 [Fusarium vanettenii 77-13-4]
MKASLSCLPCWGHDEDVDEVVEIGRVASQHSKISIETLIDATSAENEVAQEKRNSLAELSWQDSKGDLVLEHIRCVADHEYIRQSQSYNVSNCETMIAEVRGTFEARKLVQTLGQFEKPLYAIEHFVRGITVVVQVADPIAQIIWGGFLILLKNAARFADLIGTILNCVCNLSKMLERFRIYNDMYATERVKVSLSNVCACCVEFCAAAAKIRGKIEEASRDFMAEVNLQQAKETHFLTKGVKPRATRIPCHLIPFSNRLFFPRPAIMEWIEAHLLPGESTSPTGLRSFLLHGLGGSGKTQLAAKFAHDHRNDYEIIIWAIADSVSDSLKADIGIDYKWLVIFDNVDNEELLQNYWPSSARGSILVTSRQRILGTTLVDGACEVGSLNDAEGASMIQLILDNKVSDANDRELVAEMANILCGLPLALAQMAGYLRTNHVTVREFLGDYKSLGYARNLFGNARSLDHPQYRHTLETVWQLSFKKLSIDAQTLLRIAVFLHPDGISRQLFQIPKALSDMPLPPALQILQKSHNTLRYNEAKSSLTQQFLMKYNDQELSLSIHRQVQQSALHELLDGDLENLRMAIFGATRALYHAYPRQSPLGEPIPNWPACQQYTAHVLHLLALYETETRIREATDPQTLALMTELLCDCGVYLWARGLFRDSERMARTSIEIAERVFEPHNCLRAQPYTLLGCICLRSEERTEEAVKYLELALQIRKENLRRDYKHTDAPLHIDIQLANAYSNLGIAAKQMGEFEKAAQLHEKTIEIKERRRDHCAGFLLALSFHNKGKLRRLQGHVEEAANLFAECNKEMRIYKDDKEMEARQAVWLCSLAEAEASLGRAGDAELHFSQSLQMLKAVVGDSLDTGMTRLRFGTFRYETGSLQEAEALFKDAEKIFGSKNGTARDGQFLCKNKLACALHWLGRTYAQLGKNQDSDEAQGRASKLYGEITGKQIPADAQEALAEYEKLVSDD